MTFRMQPSSAGAWSPPSVMPSGTQNFVDLLKPSNDIDSEHFTVPITSQSATPFTTLQYPYPTNLQKILLENDGFSSPEFPDTASFSSGEDADFTEKLLETFLQGFDSTAIDAGTLQMLGLNSRPVSVKSESDTASLFSFIEQSRSPSPPNADSTLVQTWPLEGNSFTSTTESSSSIKEETDESLQRLLIALEPTSELYCHDKPPIDAPPPRRRSSANVEATGPPRPANAFILYRRQQQAHLRRTCPGIHLRTASKLIAIWWKNETDAVKAHYRAEAISEKKLHQVKYPDYQYKPKGNKERKASKPMLMKQHQQTSTKDLLDFYYSPLSCENRPQQQQLQQQVTPLLMHNYDDPFTGFPNSYAYLCGYQRQLPFNQ